VTLPTVRAALLRSPPGFVFPPPEEPPPGLPRRPPDEPPEEAGRRPAPGLRRDSIDRRRPPREAPGRLPRVPPAHAGSIDRSLPPSAFGREEAPPDGPPEEAPGRLPRARPMALPRGLLANLPSPVRRRAEAALPAPGNLLSAPRALPERRTRMPPATPAAVTPAAIHHTIGEANSTSSTPAVAASGRPRMRAARRGSMPVVPNCGGTGALGLACGFTTVSPVVSPGEAGRESRSGRGLGAGVGRGGLGGLAPSGGQLTLSPPAGRSGTGRGGPWRGRRRCAGRS
jgi:hypothetical protein